jgi:hypothetical protein
MRLYAMITHIRETFPEILTDQSKADIVASAMTEADHDGHATFTYNGIEYTMRAVFDHGCINWDCNPATCYTNWTLDTVPDVS